MAARTAQTLLTAEQALAFVAEHGIVCESVRRGTIPSLVDAIAGEIVKGNWWSHRNGRAIFAITRSVRDAVDILTCKLVDGKITFVHERLWPALVCLAEEFGPENLAGLKDIHTATGRHVVESIPFPNWVPQAVIERARHMTRAEALSSFRAHGFPPSAE